MDVQSTSDGMTKEVNSDRASSDMAIGSGESVGQDESASKSFVPSDSATIDSLSIGARRFSLFRWGRKLVVLVLGLSVVSVGVVMLVAPGPAFLVIPAGLAILATEFFWAKRLLNWMRHQVASRLADRLQRREKQSEASSAPNARSAPPSV